MAAEGQSCGAHLIPPVGPLLQVAIEDNGPETLRRNLLDVD